jgi:hypothetical protein
MFGDIGVLHKVRCAPFHSVHNASATEWSNWEKSADWEKRWATLMETGRLRCLYILAFTREGEKKYEVVASGAVLKQFGNVIKGLFDEVQTGG